MISRLYDIERSIEAEPIEVKQQLRIEHAAPILAEFKTWLDGETFLPKSLIGKAATYSRNQWTAPNRYTAAGELSIDNNMAERCMKPVAVGRKNWLFIGSVKAGQRAANLMTLIASCKENRVEPWAYLRDIFTHLPLGHPPESLLPNAWLTDHPRHRWSIADRRAEERESKGDL